MYILEPINIEDLQEEGLYEKFLSGIEKRQDRQIKSVRINRTRIDGNIILKIKFKD